MPIEGPETPRSRSRPCPARVAQAPGATRKCRHMHSARRCVGQSDDQGIGNPGQSRCARTPICSQLIAGVIVFR